MLSIESLTTGKFNTNLLYYYALYQICNLLYSHFLDMLRYIKLWVEPLIFQSFYLDSRGSSNIYDYVAYIYLTNSGRVNKDYTERRNGASLYPDTLSPGHYVITYNNKFVIVNYSQHVHTDGGISETLSMWCASMDRNFFNKFTDDVRKNIKDSRSLYIKEYGGRLWINGSDVCGLWHKVGQIPKRLLRDTILDEKTVNEIMTIISDFYKKPEYYAKYNIPYKLCILLSGEPGMGKTSFIKSIANEFDLNCYNISLTSLTDELLPFVFSSVKKQSVLVFEDIECMTIDRKDDDEQEIIKNKSTYNNKNKTVSLSAFLNALDGIVVTEGLLIIMTTNYPEKLDAALIRQERVHYHCKIEKSVEVYYKMFKRFFPDINSEKVNLFAETCLSKKLNLADVQAHCVKYLNKPEIALNL